MEGPYFQAPTAQKETITQWRWVQAAILKTESPVQHQLFCDLVHALKRNLFLRTGHTAVNFLHTNETIFWRCTYWIYFFEDDEKNWEKTFSMEHPLH